MGRRLRFGLIGSGSQGRYLSDALKMTGRAELVACADINREAAELARDWCGYDTAYTDTQRMLAQEDLDAVLVATTHDQLQPNALAAVRAGKHVFVEKPMALTAGDGRKLVRAARDAGVKLMVGYTLRFFAARIRLKELLDSGAVGEVTHVIAGQALGSLSRGWLGERARGGGPLFFVGSHVIDQVLWVTGRRAERVFAEINRNDPTEVEQDALLTIRFEGGAVAQVCTSQRLGVRYGWLDVLGSRGRLRAEWDSNVIHVESRALDAYGYPTVIEIPPHSRLPQLAAGASVRIVACRDSPGWITELAEFVDAIEQNRAPSVTGEDGVRVLEIIDAAIESGATGQLVALTAG